MKSSALLVLVLPAWVCAAPPSKPNDSRYTPLWTNSPFTVKPPPQLPSGPPPVNKLDDYALGGVTQFPNGYFVVLIDKKNPQKTEIIQPGIHSDFKVLKVSMGEDSISEDGKVVNEGASVLLAYGSMQGEVKYDEKVMAMRSSAIPKQGASQMLNRPILPPGVSMGGNIPNTPNGTPRAVRPRFLPPQTIPQPQSSAPQIPQPQIQQNQQGQTLPSNLLPPPQ